MYPFFRPPPTCPALLLSVHTPISPSSTRTFTDLSFLRFPTCPPTHPSILLPTSLAFPILPSAHLLFSPPTHPSVHPPPSSHHCGPGCMSQRKDDGDSPWVWRQRPKRKVPPASISLSSSEKMSRMCCLPCPTLMTISFCAGSEVRAEVGRSR